MVITLNTLCNISRVNCYYMSHKVLCNGQIINMRRDPLDWWVTGSVNNPWTGCQVQGSSRRGRRVELLQSFC